MKQVLVKKLEELGIGRPSTYAPTISTIQNRGYVVREEDVRVNHAILGYFGILNGQNITKQKKKTENTGAERGKMFPTDIGAVVNDFPWCSISSEIVDYNFTAGVEKQFDEIAQAWKNGPP